MSEGSQLTGSRLIHSFQSFAISDCPLFPDFVPHKKPRWLHSNSLIRPKKMGTRV